MFVLALQAFEVKDYYRNKRFNFPVYKKNKIGYVLLSEYGNNIQSSDILTYKCDGDKIPAFSEGYLKCYD